MALKTGIVGMPNVGKVRADLLTGSCLQYGSSI